jgi:hypothetical protein
LNVGYDTWDRKDGDRAHRLGESALTRTILYFPTIAVPNGTWLRRALLYWDEVASIVPHQFRSGDYNVELGDYDVELGELIPYTPEVQYLLSEGAFKPIPPDLLSDSFMCELYGELYLGDQPSNRRALIREFEEEPSYRRALIREFEDEFTAAVTSDAFERLLSQQRHRKLDARLHEDKMSHRMMLFLIDKNLAQFDEGDEERSRYESRWFLVEQKTALLYMSLLAKYLANTMENFTVPGTDREEYMNLSYAPLSDEPGEVCLGVHLVNCLPVPREDVPLSEILVFRDHRKDELRHFRTCMDDLEKKLSEAENGQELKRIVQQSKETFEREINNLETQLRDEGLATKLGSVKTLFTIGNPALVGWLAEAMGYGEKVPIDLGLAGLAASASIGVSQFWMSQRNARKGTLRESPYAYLYYGRAGSIL